MDGNLPPFGAEIALDAAPQHTRPLQPAFGHGKRVFDVLTALVALPFVASIALVLLVLNPIWNRGPLLFVQRRMGRDCKPFMAYKFRTMRCTDAIDRGPDDPVETDRITPLGQVLRKSRLDELPQFLNVLRGEMSVIGPRPDYWEHALYYSDSVPGYRLRYAMRPGITGLAQVDCGYAEGIEETLQKTRHDLRYISRAGFGTDAYVLWRTVVVVLTGFGAR